MHLDFGEFLEDRRHVRERRPVVLDVLPRGEMTVATIIGPGDMGELAHLPAVERAIGNGDAQHVGVKLKVHAVHQPQGLERVLGNLSRQPARDLVAELVDARFHEGVVEFIVAVHD